MNRSISAPELLERIRALEHEVSAELEAKERQFRYTFEAGRARFEESVARHHQQFKTWLPHYILHSRILAWVTAPFVYLCLLPMLLCDASVSLYQFVSFPALGIPKVRRRDHFVFDRANLAYLNALEAVNCAYCSYANGLFSYLAEIAARTEQHWCPIKHAQRLRSPHSRYARFFDYGDAESYARRLEELRSDFKDITSPPKTSPPKT